MRKLKLILTISKEHQHSQSFKKNNILKHIQVIQGHFCNVLNIMHVPPACLLLKKSGCKNETVRKRVPITKEINLLQFLKLWYRCITLLYMFCGLVRQCFSSTDCGFRPKSSVPSQITIPVYNLLVLVSGRAIMMCAFLLYDPKKEKRSSQPVHPYSYRAWQKLPSSCPMYRAFTESSLHPANEDECLLGRKRLAVINFPKIIRVRHAT